MHVKEWLLQKVRIRERYVKKQMAEQMDNGRCSQKEQGRVKRGRTNGK